MDGRRLERAMGAVHQICTTLRKLTSSYTPMLRSERSVALAVVAVKIEKVTVRSKKLKLELIDHA